MDHPEADKTCPQATGFLGWVGDDFADIFATQQLNNFTAALAQIGHNTRGSRSAENSLVGNLQQSFSALEIDPNHPNIAAFLMRRKDAESEAALETLKPIFIHITNTLRYSIMESFYRFMLWFVFGDRVQIQSYINMIKAGTVGSQMREDAAKVYLLRRHLRTIILKTYTGMCKYVELQRDAAIIAQSKPDFDARIAYTISQNTGLVGSVSHEALIRVLYMIIHFPQHLTMPNTNSDPCYVCGAVLHSQRKQCVTFSGYSGPTPPPDTLVDNSSTDQTDETSVPLSQRLYHFSFCEQCYKIIEALDRIFRFDQMVYSHMRDHLKTYIKAHEGEIDQEEFIRDFMSSTHIRLTNTLSDAVKTATVTFEGCYNEAPSNDDIDRAMENVIDVFTVSSRKGVEDYDTLAKFLKDSFDESPYRRALDHPRYIMPPQIHRKREARKKRLMRQSQQEASHENSDDVVKGSAIVQEGTSSKDSSEAPKKTHMKTKKKKIMAPNPPEKRRRKDHSSPPRQRRRTKAALNKTAKDDQSDVEIDS